MPPVFGPSVAIADALMVAGGQERHDGFAVHEGEDAHFLPRQVLLD